MQLLLTHSIIQSVALLVRNVSESQLESNVTVPSGRLLSDQCNSNRTTIDWQIVKNVVQSQDVVMMCVCARARVCMHACVHVCVHVCVCVCERLY